MGALAPKRHIQVAYDKRNSKRLFLRVVDGDNQVVLALDFENQGAAYGVNLQLATLSEAKKAFNLFNRLPAIIKQLPLEVVQRTNVPRLLAVPEERYIFRSRTTAARRASAPATAFPVACKTVWNFANGHFWTFTGFLATDPVQKVWRHATGRPTPSDEEFLPLPAAPVVPINDNDTPPRPMLGTCGGCALGMLPTLPSQIKARRYRREWIGCWNEVACLSDSDWFHVRNDYPGRENGQRVERVECSGLADPGLMRSRGLMKCLCKKCRVGKEAEVDENGFLHV